MLKDYTESNTFKKLRETAGRIPLIRQPAFLITSCVALVLYGSMLFWDPGKGLPIRIALSLFVALLVLWTGIIVTDERRGERLKTGTVFSVLAI